MVKEAAFPSSSNQYVCQVFFLPLNNRDAKNRLFACDADQNVSQDCVRAWNMSLCKGLHGDFRANCCTNPLLMSICRGVLLAFGCSPPPPKKKCGKKFFTLLVFFFLI